MWGGFLGAMLNAGDKAPTVVAVTAGTATATDYAYSGLRTANDSDQGGGSPATVGSATPSTFRSRTIEELATVSSFGAPTTFIFTLDGNLAGSAPFSKIELYNNGVLEKTLLRSAAATPGGTYYSTNSCTYWTWTLAGTETWPATSPTVRIYP